MSSAARSLPIVLILCAAPWHPATAQSIHKCLIDGALQYRDSPCDASQVSLPHSIPASVPVVAVEGKATLSTTSNNVENHGRALAPREQSSDMFRSGLDGGLVMGMSDTVILNRARWGRPHKIARSRSPEGFREEWTYVSRVDGSTRVLQFLNGRLAAMDLEPRPAIAAMPEAAPAGAQKPPTPVAIAPDTSARMQVAAVWSEDDENAAERAQQAAKVLEHAGLVRSRPAEQASAGSSSAMEAATGTTMARTPSAQIDARPGSETSAPGRGDSPSSTVSSARDTVVMIHLPAPESQPQ